MPKAKDGSECYTRVNKSGGKYITCEGTQKGSKGKKVTPKPKKMKKEDEVRPVKFIITYVLTKEMAEHLYDEPDEIKKAMTKPSKSSFTIPKPKIIQ